MISEVLLNSLTFPELSQQKERFFKRNSGFSIFPLISLINLGFF